MSSLMVDALDSDMPRGRLRPTSTAEQRAFEHNIFFADWEGFKEGFVKKAVGNYNSLVLDSKAKPAS
ncbi:hypothetical protein KFE25_009129 [Diacronema lutheri]|uniref:Uncharacterized protein n=1 Tax=Diacronema lutheri TaxID=2081491 RepID=A0A8J6CK56_DIALT|nr:hypothetical protein KFE25_009129 [Diacronema lutheri]